MSSTSILTNNLYQLPQIIGVHYSVPYEKKEEGGISVSPLLISH